MENNISTPNIVVGNNFGQRIVSFLVEDGNNELLPYHHRYGTMGLLYQPSSDISTQRVRLRQ